MNPESKADPSSSRESIAVQPFSKRISTWPEDDWSGISNLQERRKLQNRINQRVRRLRKQGSTTQTDQEPNENVVADASSSGQDPQSETDATSIISLERIEDVHILEVHSAVNQAIMRHLEGIVYRLHLLGSPRTDLLLHLIQFNFTKALMENMKNLRLTSEQLHDDALSPFNTTGPWQFDLETCLPGPLQPTSTQRAVLHHPWLDLLASPQLRDNLIHIGEALDETEFCQDLKGCGSTQTGRTGIIIWENPWDPMQWEVTEPFARTWGFVLKDCWDLFRSTNYWRARRNERPLFRLQ